MCYIRKCDIMKLNFKSFKIAQEGHIFIFIFAVVTFVLFFISSFLGAIGLVATVWCVAFFRDPDRVTPQDNNLIIAPADGKIIKIENITNHEAQLDSDSESSINLVKVSIFMNVFNVHVNRSPCSGKIEDISYFPGAFVNASFDKASKKNERQMFKLKTSNNQIVYFVQIAGLIARRIVKFVKVDDEMLAGEKFGLIKFGSRVDLYLPRDVILQVSEGQVSVAGETVIAKFAESSSVDANYVEYKILDRPAVDD